jgi:hypothetical protein
MMVATSIISFSAHYWKSLFVCNETHPKSRQPTTAEGEDDSRCRVMRITKTGPDIYLEQELGGVLFLGYSESAWIAEWQVCHLSTAWISPGYDFKDCRLAAEHLMDFHRGGDMMQH